ncbi:acyl-CoA thioesterase [Polyangium spumosum]|uniref:Acyl-CoA thioesterase n=1 Tax=Polyangium spumosum TaxID=889282 RepID=A0A6N7PVP3_9BACT|nr:thioesterase family protein [Polyangium spumosum]MRG96053.1 acyl-CoA thioesterase [Polyangium spumosum]
MSERPRLSSEDLVHAQSVLHAEDRPVRFQDVDAAGIIYFARVLEYFHDAFLSLLRRAGVDLAAVLKEGKWGMPLGHAEADYLGPMRFGDDVVVEIVRLELGERSLSVGARVRSPEGRVLAIGQAVHVCIDRQTFRSRALPDETAAALKAVGAQVRGAG